MAAAGRKMGTRHQDDVRAKIQTSNIIHRLTQGFNGEVELTTQQINIAKTLLDKSLPSLIATEISGAGEDGEIKSSLTVNFINTSKKD